MESAFPLINFILQYTLLKWRTYWVHRPEFLTYHAARCASSYTGALVLFIRDWLFGEPGGHVAKPPLTPALLKIADRSKELPERFFFLGDAHFKCSSNKYQREQKQINVKLPLHSTRGPSWSFSSSNPGAEGSAFYFPSQYANQNLNKAWHSHSSPCVVQGVFPKNCTACRVA